MYRLLCVKILRVIGFPTESFGHELSSDSNTSDFALWVSNGLVAGAVRAQDFEIECLRRSWLRQAELSIAKCDLLRFHFVLGISVGSKIAQIIAMRC